MVALAGTAIVQVGSVRDAANLATTAQEVSSKAQLLDSVVAQARVAQTNFITDVHMYGPSAASDEAPRRANYVALAEQATQLAADFPTDVLSEGSLQLVEDVRAQTESITQLDRSAIAFYQQPGYENLLAGDSEVRQSVAAFSTIRDRLTELVKSADAAAHDAIEEQDSAVWNLIIVLVVTLAVSSVVMLGITRYISTRIRNAVSAVRDSMEAIREQDLTVTCDIDSEDELGQLAAGTEATRAQLANLIGSVNSAALSVAASSDQVQGLPQGVEENSRDGAEAAKDSADMAQEVTSQIETVTASTDEMMAAISEIAQSASEASRIALGAVLSADAAGEAVARLGMSSQEISSVVKAITNIAEQTNMLALNATIEAARAGEAGKGFAVVASEVKDLARATAEATEDIGRRVAAIQTDTNGAVEAITEISNVIAAINESQATIAAAVEEQTATTSEMSRNTVQASNSTGGIRDVLQGSVSRYENTLEGATEMTAAATDLKERAADLLGMVEVYRVE